MRVSVDAQSCVGAGHCVTAAPDVFDQDPDTGTAVVRPVAVAAADRAAVRRVADLCPVRAIDISDDA